MTAMYWHEWPGAAAFEDAALTAYRAISGPLLDRAAVSWDWQSETCGPALMDALITGRPFSFWHVDTIDRVRMRDEWAVLRRALADEQVTKCGMYLPKIGT